MQRVIVSPLFDAASCDLSTGGNRLNQSGICAFAGLGSAITPKFSGRQVKLMTGAG